ncbi:MAG TPA: hypothetical protein VHC63_07135 [Acidimicrobiales bacterium]|nr:hypothetical protein [Acidimicrobiales bacterium]
MVRRPLVATVVTTAAGALLGALLGAVVGRVIALFGDETVQTSVPMVFCGTLGFFVGGASAAKGSLDRFGARRSGLGAFVAVVLLIGIVGGASLSHQAGLVVFALAVVAVVVAGAAATLVAAPQDAPVARGGVPRAVPPPKQAEAAPQEQTEAEFIVEPERAPQPTPVIRKVAVAPEPEPEPEPEPQPEPEPVPAKAVSTKAVSTKPVKKAAKTTKAAAKAPARPKRDRPLRAQDAPPAITPPPAPRKARERPIRKGDQ